MAISVKHTKVSAVADGADTSVVRPSDWNADHTLIGLGTAAALDAGVANGVATLDGSATVPISQLPAAVLGAVSYQGTWNASTNTPTLASGVGTKGYYYVVSVAGSTNLDGITDWKIGDWAIYNGSAWQKIDNTDAVQSVNGYTGAVVLNASDVGAVPYTGATAAVDLNAKTLTNVSRLGINSTAVPDILLRAYGDNNSTSRMAIRGYSNDANSSSMRVAKFRGTFAAPQAPQSGDSLGKFELAGYGTTSSSGYPQASIEGLATENWGATARGAKAVIKVTPNTTINQVTALTINQDSTAVFANTVTANSVLLTGNLGTVTGVTGTAPVVSSGGTTPAISMAAATASADGYLTSADWTTFNGKQPAGTYVTSVSATAPITSSGGVTPNLAMAAATASVNGYLTSTDWATFNAKQAAFGSQTANYVYAAPNGSAGSPTFRAIVPQDLGTGTPSSGNFLRGDGAWATVSSTPAGSNTQVQFNNSGAFGAASTFTWNGTALSVPALAATTSVTSPLLQSSASNLALTASTGIVDASGNTGAITLATGTTAQRPASPVLGQIRMNTTTGYPEWYDSSSSLWIQFNQSKPYAISYLVVAGGGGGGGADGAAAASSGAGGGAGGLRTGTANLSTGTVYTITVGAGGAGGGAPNQGSTGRNSVFSTITSNGGGGGGSGYADGNPTRGSGLNGGSGGGAGGSTSTATSTFGTGNTPSTSPAQGFNGGINTANGNNARSASGGGGASAVGGNAVQNTPPGNGGAGVASSITGTSVTYAGGGGGAGWNNGANGSGGAGGGGSGGSGGGNGTANLGGGGGGGYSDAAGNAYGGGSGGSGVVILSIPTANYTGVITGSPIVTTSGANTILKYNSSGTYTA
jgi:hypothetical protein